MNSMQSDEFSTLGGINSSVQTPQLWTQSNRSGYRGDAQYINQVNKNIMKTTRATLSSYGALAGYNQGNMKMLAQMSSNDITPAFQTAPSGDYFTYATEMDT